MNEFNSQLSRFKFTWRVAILLLLSAGLCLTLLALLDRTADLDFTLLFLNPWFWPAMALQLTGLMLFVLAWFVLLRSVPDIDAGLWEAAAHIGITLIGKYLPGKVWGLLGRGYLLDRKGMSSADVAKILLADQFLTFYSGIAIGLSALLGAFYLTPGLVLLLISVVGGPVVLGSYNQIIQWFISRSESLLKKFSSYTSAGILNIDRSALNASLLVYLCHWTVISLVLCVLFYPLLQPQLLLNCLLILAAIPLAMLTGFLALWAPGGIGVREGVIIAILAINLDLQLATSIAIVYRLICIGNDLLMGTLAMVYYGKQLSSSSAE